MARSDLEEIAKLYIGALWLSRDLRRLHLEARTARELVELINITVFPLKLTVAELPAFNRIVRGGFRDREVARKQNVIGGLSAGDNATIGTGPKATYVPPPTNPNQGDKPKKDPKA